MPAPQLTNEEAYVIAYLKSDRSVSARWSWLVAQCFPAAIFIYGFATDNRAMVFTGFVALFSMNAYAFARRPRFGRAIQSAITKLEAATN